VVDSDLKLLGRNTDSDSTAFICAQMPKMDSRDQGQPEEVTTSFRVRLDTVREIVVDHWGPLGVGILDSFAATRIFETKEIEFGTLHTLMNLKLELLGPSTLTVLGTLSLAEWNLALDCLKWLLSIVQVGASRNGGTIQTRTFLPISDEKADIPTFRCVTGESVESLLDESQDCWVQLFDGGYLGMQSIFNYSVMRPKACQWFGKGLKLPFELMLQITGVDQLFTDEYGTPILTGFRSALIPIRFLPQNSVQWHFIAAEDLETDGPFRWFHDRSNFRSLLPKSIDRLKDVSINDLKGTAYLGWLPTGIEIVLGDSDPPAPIQRSDLPRVTEIHLLAGHEVQGGLQLMPIPLLASLFSVTRKYDIADLHCRFSPAENVHAMIDQLFSKQVIIYDGSKKTGFLCPLINLIVSLVRGYLRDNKYNYNRALLQFPAGVYKSQAELRRLQGLLVETDPSHKFEDVFKHIVRRYSSVNVLIPSKSRTTKSSIIGFEIADILSNEDVFYPRSLVIDNGWNMFAQSTEVVFCAGIGDVFRVRSGAPVPLCLQSPPTGYNLLVCPHQLLKKHFDTIERQNCYKQKGRKDHQLVLKGMPFAPCDDPGCDQTRCWKSRLQQITCFGKLSMADRLKPKESSPISTAILLDGDGALCFGRVSVLKSKSGGERSTIVNGTTSSQDLESMCDLNISLDFISPSCPTGIQTVKT